MTSTSTQTAGQDPCGPRWWHRWMLIAVPRHQWSAPWYWDPEYYVWRRSAVSVARVYTRVFGQTVKFMVVKVLRSPAERARSPLFR